MKSSCGFHSPCKDHDSKASAGSCTLCSREQTGFQNTSVLPARESSGLLLMTERICIANKRKTESVLFGFSTENITCVRRILDLHIIWVKNKNLTPLPSSRAADLNLLMLTTVSREVDLCARAAWDL